MLEQKINQKPTWKLRAGDFIPFKGMYQYAKRNRPHLESFEGLGFSGPLKRRASLLTFYNITTSTIAIGITLMACDYLSYH
jgi:hypothetical protein